MVLDSEEKHLGECGDLIAQLRKEVAALTA
jgi:hypothetical protein